MGKTTLALELGYRSALSSRYPDGVYWLDGRGEPTRVLSAFAPILKRVAPAAIAERIPKEPMTAPETAEIVRVALGCSRASFLLIIDDVDRPNWHQWLPGGSGGHILFTTKDRQFAMGAEVELGPLNGKEALELATKAENGSLDQDNAAAMDRVVTDTLGGIPLAVETAAKTVRNWHLSWIEYESLLGEECLELLSLHQFQGDYPRGFFGAVDLSISKCAEGTAERRLLSAIGAFAPGRMPVEWPLKSAELAGVEAHKALGTLSSLALVSVEPGGDVAMHRLVHQWVRANYPASAAHKKEALCAIAEWVSSRVAPTCYAEIDQAFPQIEHVMANGRLMGDEEIWVRTCRAVSEHMRLRGAFAESLEMVRRTYEQARSSGASDGRVIADLKSDIGVGLLDLGRFEEAMEWLTQALTEHEELLGTRDLQVAITRTNLGIALMQLDRVNEAKVQFLSAMQIDLADPKGWNPNRNKFFCNLGSALQATGHIDDALIMLQAGVALSERMYGTHHPDVALTLNTLGTAYRAAGRLDDARQTLSRALEAIKGCVGGESHPYEGLILSHLSVVAQEQSNLPDAVEYARRAVDIAENAYGPDAQQTAVCLSNLATALIDTNQPKEAVDLLQRSLGLVIACRGVDFSAVRVLRVNLGTALRILARSAEPPIALDLLERTVEEYQLAGEFVGAAVAKTDLAVVLLALGEKEKSRRTLECALEGLEKDGKRSAEGVKILSRYAGACADTGDLLSAREFLECAILARIGADGTDMAELAADRLSLAQVLNGLELFEESASVAATVIAMVRTKNELRTRDLVESFILLAVARARIAGVEDGLSVSDDMLRMLDQEVGSESALRIEALLFRVQLLSGFGRLPEAAAVHEQVVEVARKSIGLSSGSLLSLLADYGHLLLRLRRLDESLDLFRECLTLCGTGGDECQGQEARVTEFLAAVHRARGEYDLALGYQRRANALHKQMFPVGSPERAISLSNVAIAEMEAGLRQAACATMDEACSESEIAFPEGNAWRQWFVERRRLVHE
jgi:tetratricopeptide (TPR) repeat protein